MRIAVVYSHRRIIGGIETYLDTVITELVNAGHAVAFWYEVHGDADWRQITLPETAPAWCVEEIGAGKALATLRAWRPDLIYSHGLMDPALEKEVLEIAPAVIFAHGYYGTCVSGIKAFKRPVDSPCAKRFGFGCLLNYYPRGCGGLNPLTMIADYQRQSARSSAMKKYRGVIAASEHMRAEFIRNGLSPEKVFKVSLPIATSSVKTNGNGLRGSRGDSDPWRLLFLGRMINLKGGSVLLDALAGVRASIDRPLKVTFAGDGPERATWEQKAAKQSAADEGLEIEFVGWQQGEQLDAILSASDLLVMPSLWPEPFGMVGLEAGLHGVPVAAFAVGGIPEWLADGVNGRLAPGDPPTAGGLADAIIRCLNDLRTNDHLHRGALKVASRYSIESHLTNLTEVFQNVLSPAWHS